MRLSGWVGLFLVVLVGCGTKPPDVCEGIECPNGHCEAAACICDVGFELVDGACVSVCTAERCLGLPFSRCVVSEGAARCVCPSTHVELEGSCRLRGACTPNPCEAPGQTICDSSGGEARCLCDDDFIAADGGCVRAPDWNCGVVHDGDPAESDECPARAKVLPLATDADRTLSPAGDEDWFRLPVTPATVYAFTATGSVAKRLDVFTRDGVLVGVDNSERREARVDFFAPVGHTELFARVRAVIPSQRDVYVARLEDLGPDDFANEKQNARVTTNFAGRIQYAHDIDLGWLQLPALTAVELSNTDGVAYIELTRADGGTRIIDNSRTSVTVPVAERVLVTAVLREPRALGGFELRSTETGVDDHSEDVLFATPLQAGVAVNGVLERNVDVDSFVTKQTVGRIYSATLTTPAPARLEVFDFQGNAPGLGSSAGWKASSTTPLSVKVHAAFGPGGMAPYVLRLNDLGLDDHGDTPATATRVFVDTAKLGRLEYEQDVDVFSVEVTTPNRLLSGRIFTSDGDLQLTLSDAAGTVLAHNATSVTAVVGAGTYFFTIKQPSRQVTNYGLIVESLAADDHGDATSPTTLPVGSPVSGAIQFAGDVDAFRFTPIARHVYRIVADCALEASDGQGNSAVGQPWQSMTFMARNTAPWTITAGPLNAAISLPRTYTLTLTDLGVEDHGETAMTATPLSNVHIAGTLLWEGDVDAFSFPVTAGHAIAIETTGVETPQVQVLKATGTQIANRRSSAYFMADETETVTVLLTSWSSAHAVIGGYGVSAADIGVDDHGNTAATGTVITTPASLTASIQYEGDVDVLVMNVEARRFYTVSPGACEVRVFNDAGVLLPWSPTSFPYTFRAADDVTSVRFEFAARTFNGPLGCQVSVVAGAVDDHGDTAATATPFTLDAGATGVLEGPSDVDVFSVALTAGDIVDVTSGTSLSVTSPDGRSWNGFGGRIAFPVDQSGTWFLHVRSGISDTYVINARLVSDDVGNQPSSATPLNLGQVRTAALQHPADVDVFSLTLTANVPATLRVTGTVQLELRNASGTVLHTSWGTQTVTVPASGPHFLYVTRQSDWRSDDYTVLWE